MLSKVKSHSRADRHHGHRSGGASGHHGGRHIHHNVSGIYVLPVSPHIHEVPLPWGDIPMPSKSYFAGFDPPNDPLKWNQALLQAARGEQVLLQRVLQVIRSPTDLWEGDKEFKWLHRMVDYLRSKHDGWLENFDNKPRAPVVLLGYRKFSHWNHEGSQTGAESMGPNEIIDNKNFKISRKIVAIGNMDENWGWLSTYFLNRTVTWALTLRNAHGGEDNPLHPKFTYPEDQMAFMLNNPNLVMMVVSQHHNYTHPKVISLPLGLVEAKDMWHAMNRAARSGAKKENLLFSAGSNYAYRTKIRACVAENLGSAFTMTKEKVNKEAYRMKLLGSAASLCMPGLGYDTYRLWETLASGAMAVMERGMGMDRTFYKLPVMLLDDFAELTALNLRQAYVEALYLADKWEYERMTRRYWEQLIFTVSEASSIDYLLEKHPMHAIDLNFTRPLVPFDCEAMGGCGKGTKRVPKKSCAINPANMNKDYVWRWNHDENSARRSRRNRRKLLRTNSDSSVNKENESIMKETQEHKATTSSSDSYSSDGGGEGGEDYTIYDTLEWNGEDPGEGEGYFWKLN